MSQTTLWVDSHAHLSSPPLLEHIDAILARAKAVNIEKILNICTDAEGVIQGKEISKKYPWLFHAGAVHPHDVEKEGKELFPIMSAHAKNGDFIAVGETGLDYFYTHSSKELQQEYLRKHIKLAQECNLPLIIHCREAYEDFFRIVDEECGKKQRGVLHCFTGALEEAKQGLARGWYISFSGIITFKKSTELREVVRHVPLNRLLIETDAPFLSPQTHRGKPNEPAFMIETGEVVAAIKNISQQELSDIIKENFNCLFNR